MTCTECGKAKDVNKSLETKKRLQKGYLDVVRENAIKKQKDPALEVRKATMNENYEFIGFQNNQADQENLSSYLRRVNKQPERFNRRPKELPSRACEVCGVTYQPKIIMQKYCGAACGKIGHEEVTARHWKEKP
jgi:hypothetical protein